MSFFVSVMAEINFDSLAIFRQERILIEAFWDVQNAQPDLELEDLAAWKVEK